MQIDSQSLNLEAKKIALERDAVQALRRIEAQRVEFELNKQRWADEQIQLDQQLDANAAAAAEAERENEPEDDDGSIASNVPEYDFDVGADPHID